MDGEGSFVIAMGEGRGEFRGMSCELIVTLLVDEEAGACDDQELQRELKKSQGGNILTNSSPHLRHRVRAESRQVTTTRHHLPASLQ